MSSLSLGSSSFLLVRLNFGQERQPVHLLVVGKAWETSHEPLATRRRSFPLAIDGTPSAHQVAKDAEVSHAVARLGPQSMRLGTAPRGCLRWRCHNGCLRFQWAPAWRLRGESPLQVATGSSTGCRRHCRAHGASFSILAHDPRSRAESLGRTSIRHRIPGLLDRPTVQHTML